MDIKTYFYKLNLHIYDKLGQKHDFLKSKTKYLETMRYTGSMVEYDILDQSVDLLKLSYVRVFNFTRWIWHYHALRYFFLKCKISFLAKFFLLITETFKFAPLVLFFSYKFDQQYLIGWTAGYYSNKFRIHRYVQEKGLDHLYNFTNAPGIVVFLGFFLKRTEKALAELMTWLSDSFIVSFTSLYDNYNFFFYNILTSKTDLKIYFFLQLLFALVNINQKNIVFYSTDLKKSHKSLLEARRDVKTYYTHIQTQSNTSKIPQFWKLRRKVFSKLYKILINKKKKLKKKSSDIYLLKKIDLKGKIFKNRYDPKFYNFRKPKRIFSLFKKKGTKTHNLYTLLKKNYMCKKFLEKKIPFRWNLNKKTVHKSSPKNMYKFQFRKSYLYVKQYVNKYKNAKILRVFLKKMQKFALTNKIEKSKIILLNAHNVKFRSYKQKLRGKLQASPNSRIVIKNKKKLIVSRKPLKVVHARSSRSQSYLKSSLLGRIKIDTRSRHWDKPINRNFSTLPNNTKDGLSEFPSEVADSTTQKVPDSSAIEKEDFMTDAPQEMLSLEDIEEPRKTTIVTVDNDFNTENSQLTDVKVDPSSVDIIEKATDGVSYQIDISGFKKISASTVEIEGNYCTKELARHFASSKTIFFRNAMYECRILPHAFEFKGALYYFLCEGEADLRRFKAKTWNPAGEFKRSQQLGYSALREFIGPIKKKGSGKLIAVEKNKRLTLSQKKKEQIKHPVTHKECIGVHPTIIEQINKVIQKEGATIPTTTVDSSTAISSSVDLLKTSQTSDSTELKQLTENSELSSTRTAPESMQVLCTKYHEMGDLSKYFLSKDVPFKYSYIFGRSLRPHKFVTKKYEYFMSCSGPKDLARITSSRWTPDSEMNRSVQLGYTVEFYALNKSFIEDKQIKKK